MAQTLLPGEGGALLLFHVVLRGHCWAEVDGGPSLELSAGDIIVFPRGDAHAMGATRDGERVPWMEILPPLPWDGPPRVVYGGSGAHTDILCGYFHCDTAVSNPLLSHLPPVFSVSGTEGKPSEWLAELMNGMIRQTGDTEPGAGALVARIAELMFLDVVRRYVSQHLPESGLLRALGEPELAPAIERVHADPARPWTVGELARRTGVSRSRFAARFTAVVGMPPMQYVTRLRLERAARLLRDSPKGVAEIAWDVGYQSEAAFRRAFKRYAGEPPAQWRDARRAAREAGAPAQ